MLLTHWARRAASRAACTAGKSRPINTAMMAITTSNSIRVKPRRRSRGRGMRELPGGWVGGDRAMGPDPSTSGPLIRRGRVAPPASSGPCRGGLGLPALRGALRFHGVHHGVPDFFLSILVGGRQDGPLSVRGAAPPVAPDD